MKTNYLLLATLVLSLGVVGCKTGNKGTTPLGAESSAKDSSAVTPINDAGKMAGDNGVSSTKDMMALSSFDPDSMAQDRAALASQAVYFDYDSSSIRSSEQSKITAVAGTLQSDPSAKLLVEGNCDERGTEEYNRSLGERRALSAREALAALGISADRIATRSYGEDKAADPSHNEAAWSKNRRDEFVLLHPK